jgi:hypothetical protein
MARWVNMASPIDMVRSAGVSIYVISIVTPPGYWQYSERFYL